MKRYKTKYGSFSSDGREYVITTPQTPRPWTNILTNGDYGAIVSQTGSGYSWRSNAQLNRISRWEQDLIKDEWGKYIYLRDNDTEAIWSAGCVLSPTSVAMPCSSPLTSTSSRRSSN